MKIILFILFFVSTLFASIGKVSAVVGDATLKRANETIKVAIGLDLKEKDIISTSTNSKVQLIFKDSTIITVGKNSALDIAEYLYDQNNPKNSKTDFNFFKGAFKTITGKIGKINKEKFKLRTKSAAIGIRGTVILGSQTTIACTQGAITVFAAGQQVNVNANQLTQTQPNTPPTQPKNITNDDISNLEESLEPEAQKEEKKTESEESKKESETDSKKEEKESKKKEKKEKNDKKKESKKSKKDDKKKSQQAKKDNKKKSQQAKKNNSKNNNQKQAKSNNQNQTKQSRAAARQEARSNKKATRTKVTKIDDSSQNDASASSTTSSTTTSGLSTNSSSNNTAAAEAATSVAANTTQEAEEFESGTVTVNSITSDDVLSVSEGQNTVTVTGTASGGDISSGDTVSFKVNGTEYTTTVGSGGSWSVDVAGSNLRADNEFEVIVSSSNDSGSIGTSSITSNHTNTQSGKFLGVYLEAAGDADNFVHEDTTFEATKSDKTLSYDDTIQDTLDAENFNISGSVTSSSSFTTPGVGAYSSNSEIGTFSQSYVLDNGTSKTSTFKVQADNTGEFFVAYSDSSTTGVTGLDEMFVVGADVVSSNLSSSKVYMYKTFKTLNVEKDSTGKLKSDSKFSTDVGYQYYNAGLNSLTHINKDVFEKGARSFVAGTSTTMTFYDNEYNYTPTVTGGALLNYENFFSKNDSGTSVVELKGTEGQGLIASMDTTKYQYSSSGTVSEKQEMLNASFLQTDKTYSVTNSGTSTLVGLVSYLAVQDNSAPMGFTAKGDGTDIISFDVNKATGAITDGEINQDANNPADYAALEFAGTLSASTSYYVSEDLFGVLATAGSTSKYKDNGTDYTLSDTTQGYLIAVPDGGYDASNNFIMFDSNDNPMMSDDDSSWGYWSADVGGNNDFHINPLSTWVAGIETATSVMDGLLNGTSTDYIFNGKVIGFVKVTDGTNVTAIENIAMDDTTNQVKMTFDLGGGTGSLKTGTNESFMKFSSASTSWNMNMTTTSVNNSGFAGTMSGTGQTGNFNGNFYGDGSLKSVGGNFDATQGNNSAQGVFKATKQ